MQPAPIAHTALDGLLFRNRGKVRDIYEVGDALLIVATDRLSAFDWVLADPIPLKGIVLNQLSVFWLKLLEPVTRSHLITADVDAMPAAVRRHKETIRGRSMLVTKARPFPVECIVRGYLTGSGWKDYQATGAVSGIELPPGLKKLARLEPPVFTPSTKAETGHDRNIDFAEFRRILGGPAAERLRQSSLDVFRTGSEHALSRGVVLCDTKLEWGTAPGGNGEEVLLIDEVLTPDSSRFWRASDLAATKPGGEPPSLDKQVVRDYLETTGWDKNSPPPRLPPDVIRTASERYVGLYELITGKKLEL